MKYLTKLTLILLATLCLNSLQAQEKKREIGIRLSPFAGTDLLLKKERKENKYRRIRLGVGPLGFAGIHDPDEIQLSLNAFIGWEKRKELKENLYLIKGWEIGVRTSSFERSGDLNLQLGYIIGLLYQLNDQLSIGIEAIPAIGTGFERDNGNQLRLDIGPSSTSGLLLAYKLPLK